MSDLSRGYCNTVHRVDTACGEGKRETVVVKLYSDLSKLRVAEDVRGVPDALAAAAGIAPPVLRSTHDGERTRPSRSPHRVCE